MACSPDGHLLAFGDINGDIFLWDAKTLRQIDVLTGHTSAVTAAAFPPDGSTLASGNGDTIVYLWDLSSFR